jgi:hypothetical protein
MVLLLVACALPDPNDCRVSDDCEVFQPEGLVCGLVHAGVDGNPGSECLGHDPAYDEGWGLGQDASCPEGFTARQIADAAADDTWVFCAAEGNAEVSSADLDEVPRNAICGLNTVMGRGTENLCMGHDPTRAECPDGFDLRYGLELESLGTENHVNVLVWCELMEGCVEGDCVDPPDVVCALNPTLLEHQNRSAEWLDWLDREELTPELLEFLQQDVANGGVGGPGTCQGVHVDADCPDGMDRVCLPDLFDATNEGSAESFCWCSRSETLRSPI